MNEHVSPGDRANVADRCGDVYSRLRRDLTTGAFGPGEKIRPHHVAPRYAVTPAALREALLRLAAEGFVERHEQRGFRNVRTSRETTWEIVHYRVLLEAEGARLSIARGGVEWEANLAAAHHRLSHLEARMRDMADAERPLHLWAAYDRQFHEALLAACGSDVLMAQQRVAFDRFKQHVIAEDRSLGYRGLALIDEHAAILKSALARDAAACAEALWGHFEPYRILPGAPA